MRGAGLTGELGPASARRGYYKTLSEKEISYPLVETGFMTQYASSESVAGGCQRFKASAGWLEAASSGPSPFTRIVEQTKRCARMLPDAYANFSC